jgi:hypothetical protein
MQTKAHQIVLNILLALMLFITSCTTKTLTEAPILVLTPTTDIAALRSSPDYMRGCLMLNPQVHSSQANYRGIYPGRTTASEVRQRVGEPLKANDFSELSWEYDRFTILFKEEVVTQIFADDDGERLTSNLRDVINTYGCPEVIYGVDINEDPGGEYSRTLFVYLNLGVQFMFDKLPVKLTDTVDRVDYFEPSTLSNYHNIFTYLSIPNKSRPLKWNGAVH